MAIRDNFCLDRHFGPPWLAAGNESEIVAHNEDGKCHGHEECTHPEAPVTVHPLPVGTWVRFTMVAAMSFSEMPVSSHIASSCVVAIRKVAAYES
jgi:hypothetical protein